MPVFYGAHVASRLMLGTAQYPSPATLREAFRRSGAGIATVSLRRESAGAGAGSEFWSSMIAISACRSCPTPPAATR